MGEPGRGSCTFPKRKFYQARVVTAGELAIRRSKIEHCELNSCPICVAFGGIDRGQRPAGGGVFSDFYFADFAAAHFKQANKIRII